MPCYSPLQAYQSQARANGKTQIFFNRDHLDGYDSHKGIDIPCGQCIGCRLERSRQWACRLVAETQCHEKTSFLTLTYDEMPANSSLNNIDFTLFMKRLRRHFEPHKLRYFQCGEYGERKHRPHHHCILFGADFSDDRRVCESSQSGFSQYQSETLDRIWSHGRSTIGDVTFESCAYVARYTLKKVSGLGKDAHYAGRKPEFVTMSRRPGIGSVWFDQFKRDLYPGDVFVPGDDRPPTLPPKYFDKLLERTDPSLFEAVKIARKQEEHQLRKQAGIDSSLIPSPWTEETSSSRLMVREEHKQLTIKTTLKRGIE